MVAAQGDQQENSDHRIQKLFPPVELKSKKQYCPRENSNPFGGTSTEAKITLNAVIEGDANISFHSPTTVTRDFPAAF